jgi:hypothetical protein
MAERRRLFGRVVAQASTGVFLSVVQTQLESVKAQLAEVETQVSEAKAQYRLAALDAALDPEKQAAADEAIASLDALHRRRSMLQEALVLAEEREATRIDERDRKDILARQRAMAAHLASLVKEIQRVSDYADNLHHAFGKAAKAAQAASALFPHNLRNLIELVSVEYLRQLLDLQFHKIGRGELVSLHDDRRNPILLGSFEHRVTGEIPSLVEIVSDHCEGIKRAFNDQLSPKTKSTAAMHLAAVEPAVISFPGVTAGDPSSPSVDRPVVSPENAGKPSTEGDYLPKIKGQPEGDPLRPGSGPGIQLGGPLLGIQIGLGGELIERFAETPLEAAGEPEAVSGADVPAASDMAPPAPAHEPPDGDTVIADPLALRTLNDILAERVGI